MRLTKKEYNIIKEQLIQTLGKDVIKIESDLKNNSVEVRVSDINQLPLIEQLGYNLLKAKDDKGYKFISSDKNHYIKLSIDEKYYCSKVIPDFNNSLINLVATIKDYYHLENKFKILNPLSKLIKNSKHLVLIILDGLGKLILENNLKSDSFLRRNLNSYITSIFPPTTAAVTTMLRSGKLPGETGWVGWQQYFKEENRNIVLFRNRDYYTEEVLDNDVVNKLIGYEPFFKNIENVETFELYPEFMEGGFTEFKDFTNQIYKINKKANNTFTYAYWNQPDSLIHVNGCYNEIVKANIRNLNKELENLAKKTDNNTSLIITADHGLIDTKRINFKKFEKINKYLIQKPSIESRASSFVVNDKENFKTAFNKYFSPYFDLYTHDEFLKAGFIGTDYEKAEPFIGDFIAIAKSNYMFDFRDKGKYFKGNHAGLTKEEMIVPLIFYRNN